MTARSCLVLCCALAACSSGKEAAVVGDGPDAGGPADAAGSGDSDAASGSDAGNSDLPPCEEPGMAIVSDIDATLTTSDGEWLTQLLTGNHDPAEREGAAELINEYAARGYYVLYLTARPGDAQVGLTGMTATEVTMQWLTDHGYPVDPDRTRLVLAPGLVFGGSAADYKSGALTDMQAEGFTFAYAYGNATSDIDAYEAAGIGKDVTFIIGPEAGTSGTVAIDGEGWGDHTATFVEPLPAICRWP